MGTRVLAICCTPYQLLVAAQVLYAYYPDCQADLIVTDQMSGSRKVFEACRDSGRFGHVYYLEEKRLNNLPRGENLKNIVKGALFPQGLLEGEIGGIVVFCEKAGELGVGQREIHLLQHIEVHQLV